MPDVHLISAKEFCIQHNIQVSFITLLHENGLIDIANIEETIFIHEERLPDLEKLVRLHYDLDINMEGLEAIVHLLERVKRLQDELRIIQQRLRLYEEDSNN